MILETIPQIKELSVEEKLQLANELWEENLDQAISSDADSAITEVVRERLKEYQANPNSVISLEDLRKKAGLID